jgi:hypothetical protein
MSAKDTAAPPATAKAPSSAAAGTGVIRWTVLLDEHARPPVRADGAGGWVRPPRVGAPDPPVFLLSPRCRQLGQRPPVRRWSALVDEVGQGDAGVGRLGGGLAMSWASSPTVRPHRQVPLPDPVREMGRGASAGCRVCGRVVRSLRSGERCARCRKAGRTELDVPESRVARTPPCPSGRTRPPTPGRDAEADRVSLRAAPVAERMQP